jgi:hypothetical protein
MNATEDFTALGSLLEEPDAARAKAKTARLMTNSIYGGLSEVSVNLGMLEDRIAEMKADVVAFAEAIENGEG